MRAALAKPPGRGGVIPRAAQSIEPALCGVGLFYNLITETQAMRWKIIGVDKNSGVSREIWLDANSQDEAFSNASDLGIMVSSAFQDSPISISTPSSMKIDKGQLKKIKVTEMRIASGVFIGMSFFFIFWGLVSLAVFVWIIESSLPAN